MSAEIEMLPPAEEILPPAEDIRGVLVPTGFRVLVYVLPESALMANGLYQPDQTRAQEETANPVAQVIALGPDAYKDPKKFPTGPWCQPGDYIVMRPYSGTRVHRHGYPYQYRLINDDTVEAVIRSRPDEMKRAY